MKYRVTLYQTIKKEFVVMAANEDEAMEIAYDSPDSDAAGIETIDDSVEEINKEEPEDMDDDSPFGDENEENEENEEDDKRYPSNE